MGSLYHPIFSQQLHSHRTIQDLGSCGSGNSATLMGWEQETWNFLGRQGKGGHRLHSSGKGTVNEKVRVFRVQGILSPVFKYCRRC